MKDQSPSPRVDPEGFRHAIGHFASGVTVITTVCEGRPFGTTASAISSLSLEPPMLLICMNRESSTGQAIERAGVFAVNILGESQLAVAERFARKGDDKFAGIALETGLWGEPLVPDSLVTLECRVAETVVGGTHNVFLGTVAAAMATGGAPLAYYRGGFGALRMLEDDAASAELRLAAERLLIREGSVRFRAEPVSRQLVEEAIRAAFAIETGIVDVAAGGLDSGQLEQLAAALDRADPSAIALGDFDLAEYVERYLEFPERLAASVGEPLRLAYRQVNAPAILAAAAAGALSGEAAWRAASGAHRLRLRLIGALEAGDAAAAREILRQHQRVSLRMLDGLFGPAAD